MTSGAGANYTYNVQGLRTSKTVGNKTTNFTVVNSKVFSDGTYNYVWGAELITNGSVYYLYNAHGDVVQLINSSGTVTKTYDYDAYGNELTRDLNDPNPFRYCGEYYDTETGFIYLRARYYNPSNGRFISVDPAKDGLNWYAYCNNNPVSYVDPLGLSPERGVGAAIIKWDNRRQSLVSWFFTKDEAAYYFGLEYNHKSKMSSKEYEYGREYGAVIYSKVFYSYCGEFYSIIDVQKKIEEDGLISMSEFFKMNTKTVLYSYGPVTIGNEWGITPEYTIGYGRIVGNVHTHGADTGKNSWEFSPKDLLHAKYAYKYGGKYANDKIFYDSLDSERKKKVNEPVPNPSHGIYDFDIYLVNPIDELRKYSPRIPLNEQNIELDISDSIMRNILIP